MLSSRVVSGKGLTVKELKPVKKLSPNVMGVNQDRRVYDKTFELNVFTATGRVLQGSVEFSGKGNSLKLPRTFTPGLWSFVCLYKPVSFSRFYQQPDAFCSK